MIYNNKEFKVAFYKNNKGERPVAVYLAKIRKKEKAKVIKYIEFLRLNKGYLDEPYSKHIKGKIRELRVDFSRNRHRIFYFAFFGRKIILLHAFLKKTSKTPAKEIGKAEENFQDVINNPKYYG